MSCSGVPNQARATTVSAATAIQGRAAATRDGRRTTAAGGAGRSAMSADKAGQPGELAGQVVAVPDRAEGQRRAERHDPVDAAPAQRLGEAQQLGAVEAEVADRLVLPGH